MNSNIRDIIIFAFLSVILGLFISGLMVLFMGANPLVVYGRLFSFLIRDKYTFAEIFVKSTPLIFTGLAFAFTFKANLYNIGAQGQFYLGSVAAVGGSLLLGTHLPSFISLMLILLSSLLAGGIWGGFVGYVKAKFKANDFLVSMMSVYVALALMNYLLRTLLIETKREYPQTNPISDKLFIPIFIHGTRLHIGFLIAVVVAILCWLFLYRTTTGFRIRVVGMNPVAARFSGIASGRIFIIAFFISGALAGLAGFTEVNGVQHMLVQNFNPTIGGEGIGIAILANANPIGVIFGAILFGALKVGGAILGQTSNIPSSIIGIMEGFVMLFVIISFYIRKRIEISREITRLKHGEVQ